MLLPTELPPMPTDGLDEMDAKDVIEARESTRLSDF